MTSYWRIYSLPLYGIKGISILYNGLFVERKSQSLDLDGFGINKL